SRADHERRRVVCPLDPPELPQRPRLVLAHVTKGSGFVRQRPGITPLIPPLHVLLILVLGAVAPASRQDEPSKAGGAVVDTLAPAAVVWRRERRLERRAQNVTVLVHLATGYHGVGEVDGEEAVGRLRGLAQAHAAERLAVEIEVVVPDPQRA